MAPVSQVVRPRVSYSDLERQPEDGRRYEIYDGEVFVVPAPVPLHQRAVRRLLRILDEYAAAHGGEVLGSPIDIVFSEYDVLQPDLVYFSAERHHLVPDKLPIRSAPDLVVEVLSPSTSDTDRGRKLQTFARFGVPEYWIVDPEAPSLEVLALAGSQYQLRSRARGGEAVRSATLHQLTFELWRL
jgi:Uma2 family endonuclease